MKPISYKLENWEYRKALCTRAPQGLLLSFSTPVSAYLTQFQTPPFSHCMEASVLCGMGKCVTTRNVTPEAAKCCRIPLATLLCF